MNRLPGIFRTLPWDIIQPYSGKFKTLCNACICRNLSYSESWNIQNSACWRIFRTQSYLQKCTNIQDSDIFKTWHIFKTFSKDVFFFAKTVKNYNYFYKVRLLRSSTGFWIYLSLNKYSLPQWSYASCMINIENPIYYCKLRHIQPYICIFRTLPYLESCHILNPRCIQNSAKAYSSILRTL